MPFFSRHIPFDRKRLLERAAQLEPGWRWRRALTLYRHLLAAEPHDPALHARVAPLLARSGRDYEARESFRIAQSGYKRQEDLRQLEATHRAASKALPKDADVARGRARFERAQGRPEHAMRTLVEVSDRIALNVNCAADGKLAAALEREDMRALVQGETLAQALVVNGEAGEQAHQHDDQIDDEAVALGLSVSK